MSALKYFYMTYTSVECFTSPPHVPPSVKVDGAFLPPAIVGQLKSVDHVRDVWIGDSGAACHMTINAKLIYGTRLLK